MVKAVMTDPWAIEQIVARRRALGQDRWDEVWEGVYHMVPGPSVEHEWIEGGLYIILKEVMEGAGLGRVLHGVNVADPVRRLQDFRIPDICVLLAARIDLILDTYIAGGPDLVIEVVSPGDESYEKLPWYAAQGVREVLMIDRDTKATALYRLQDRELVRVAASPDVVESSVVPLRFERVEHDVKPGLRVTFRGQPAKVWEV